MLFYFERLHFNYHNAIIIVPNQFNMYVERCIFFFREYIFVAMSIFEFDKMQIPTM